MRALALALMMMVSCQAIAQEWGRHGTASTVFTPPPSVASVASVANTAAAMASAKSASQNIAIVVVTKPILRQGVSAPPQPVVMSGAFVRPIQH